MKKNLVAILLTVLITLTGCGFEAGYQGTGVAESAFNVNNYISEIENDMRELIDTKNYGLGEGNMEIQLGYSDEYGKESENPYIETLHVTYTGTLVKEGEETEVDFTYFILYEVAAEGLIMKYAF